MPVATTDTRTMPSRLSSKVAPTMMLASLSTSSRMRVAASSTSYRVRSLPPVIEMSRPLAPFIEVSSISGGEIALSAAEAAISNPLIDETSMKGAKGLLISITGGKDRTLYEVDEAATRIREEVDNEANIIVGATFDESLDGIVRVSVVATGIDVALSAHHPANTRQPIVQAAAPVPVQAAAPSPAPQAVAAASRLAELTQSLRASNQRMAERAEQRAGTNDQAHRAVAQALTAPAETAVSASAELPAPPRPQVTAIEDVTIRPMPP